jgi:hypothetical protein
MILQSKVVSIHTIGDLDRGNYPSVWVEGLSNMGDLITLFIGRLANSNGVSVAAFGFTVRKMGWSPIMSELGDRRSKRTLLFPSVHDLGCLGCP